MNSNTRFKYSQSVTLTAAQVKALNTTPIVLVAGTGGAVILVDRIVMVSTFVSVAYTGANNLEFRYTNGAGAKVTADIAAATLNFGAGTKNATVIAPSSELAPVLAANVVVSVPVANPGAGDSPVTFYIDYDIRFV